MVLKDRYVLQVSPDDRPLIVYFQTKESYLNTSVSADSDQYDHVTGVDGKRTEFFIEMAFYKTKRIIKFMNNIPGMHNLSSNARIWLFKESLAGK